MSTDSDKKLSEEAQQRAARQAAAFFNRKRRLKRLAEQVPIESPDPEIPEERNVE